MLSSPPNPPDTSNTQLPMPSPAQLLLFLLLLGWLAAAPVVVGIVTAFLPTTWPDLARHALAAILLVSLLLIPFAGFALFVRRRQGWERMRPLALILLGVGL